jgi:hypothetical protein
MPPALRVLLIAAIVGAAVSANAQQPPAANKNAKPTTLSLEWEPVPTEETAAASPAEAGDSKAAGSRRVYYFAVQTLSPLFWGGKASTAGEDKPRVRPLAISAKLKDASGAPLSYQAVGFALETSFGTLLPLGKVPTDGDGRAKLVVRDRRCGTYPFQAVYGGDQTNKVSYAQARVDFGPCPAPALPAAGILITPYKTAPITLAFTFFYGTMWVVFAYSVGYLLLYRMRRAGGDGADVRLMAGRDSESTRHGY